LYEVGKGKESEKRVGERRNVCARGVESVGGEQKKEKGTKKGGGRNEKRKAGSLDIPHLYNSPRHPKGGRGGEGGILDKEKRGGKKNSV